MKIVNMGNKSTKDDEIDKYWEFYGILIPNHIESIPSMDRVNKIVRRGGGETLMSGINVEDYSLKEYRSKFACKGKNGQWYWKE